ncbi:MAG: flippase-like domain-containing protein [Clostridiales bacterium]|nr:flippase-like domain-containing protein [Clostridiales bacterium]
MAKKLSKRTTKQILNIAFLVLLIGVTFTVLFTSQDINLGDIGSFLSKCNPWYITAAFGGLLGYILFEAISLHVITRTLKHKTKFVSSVAYSTSDLYYSAITPSASGGQPASAFYMMRDGMSGGTAGFSVLFNIIAYTIATILVGLFGVIACPQMFGQVGHWLAKTLIILGFVVQLLLLAVLLLCLFRARVILAIGNFGISFLAKLHVVKKTDKWRKKLEGVVTKYRACRGVLKKHPMLFVNALLLNVAQRVSQTLIPCFVIIAVKPDVDFLMLFCMQAYVMIGYNSIPLPGGTGVYEYLYPNVFSIGGMFDGMKFVLSAMMVSRFISYYICMIVCGLYTLVYHAVGIRKIKPPDQSAPVDEAVREAFEEAGNIFEAPTDEPVRTYVKKRRVKRQQESADAQIENDMQQQESAEAQIENNDNGQALSDTDIPSDDSTSSQPNNSEQTGEENGNRECE